MMISIDEATQDDCWQRQKETPYDPLEDIRQEHETWLTDLEGLAVEAIFTADWTPVLEHLNEIMAWQDAKLHEAQKSRASTKDLSGPGAGSNPTTHVNESKGLNPS